MPPPLKITKAPTAVELLHRNFSRDFWVYPFQDQIRVAYRTGIKYSRLPCLWGRAGKIPISPLSQAAFSMVDGPSLTQLFAGNVCWEGMAFQNSSFIPSVPTQWATSSWTKAKTCCRICQRRKIILVSPSAWSGERIQVFGFFFFLIFIFCCSCWFF